MDKKKKNYAAVSRILWKLLSFFWDNGLDLFNENSAVVLSSTKHLITADRRRKAMYKQQQENKICLCISNQTHTVPRALQWHASKVNWSIWSLSECWMKRAGSGCPLRRADFSALGLLGRFYVTGLVPNYTWVERAAAPLAHLRLHQSNLRSDLRRATWPTRASCLPLCSPGSSEPLSCTHLS